MSDIQKLVLEEEKREKFAKLIQKAEEYIEKNAFHFLSNDEKMSVRELIQDRYKPTHNIFDEQGNLIKDAEDKIIERLCIQLQNYQARPIVINYKSFDYVDKKGNKSNTILDIFKDYVYRNKASVSVEAIYNRLLIECKFDEEKNTPDKAKKYIHENKYNYVWYVYARGLLDCIKYLAEPKEFKRYSNVQEYSKGVDLIKDLANKIKKNNTYKDIKDLALRRNFYDNIYSFGEALTYDFFKELGCTNLVKPDVHVIQLFKTLEFVDDNAKEDVVFEEFITLCKEYNDANPKYQLTPYYIDKILWLCCTGAFYEDGIIVTNMTRNNFIKYINNDMDIRI